MKKLILDWILGLGLMIAKTGGYFQDRELVIHSKAEIACKEINLLPPRIVLDYFNSGLATNKQAIFSAYRYWGMKQCISAQTTFFDLIGSCTRAIGPARPCDDMLFLDQQTGFEFCTSALFCRQFWLTTEFFLVQMLSLSFFLNSFGEAYLKHFKFKKYNPSILLPAIKSKIDKVINFCFSCLNNKKNNAASLMDANGNSVEICRSNFANNHDLLQEIDSMRRTGSPLSAKEYNYSLLTLNRFFDDFSMSFLLSFYEGVIVPVAVDEDCDSIMFSERLQSLSINLFFYHLPKEINLLVKDIYKFLQQKPLNMSEVI